MKWATGRVPAIQLVIGTAVIIAALLLFNQFKSDFIQSYAAVWGWWHGLEPSGHTSDLVAACCPEIVFEDSQMRTPHPPFATLFALPLGLLSWPTARLLWACLSGLSIVWASRIVRAEPGTCLSLAWFSVVALGLGTHEPLLVLLLALAAKVEKQAGVSWGQPEGENTGILLQGNRVSILIGILVGSCAAIKVYPGLLIAGLWLARRRISALTAVASAAIATLASEVILGSGTTLNWVYWLRVNTGFYVDLVDNTSLVRLVRVVLGPLDPVIITLALFVLFVFPLRKLVSSGQWMTPLIPIILLISPLSWRHYMVLLVLCRLSVFEKACLGVAAVAHMAVASEILPAGGYVPIVVQVPPLIALLSMWYRQVVGESSIESPGVRRN